jgi:outer membrane murein-binding lipoprotein Lpp
LRYFAPQSTLRSHPLTPTLLAGCAQRSPAKQLSTAIKDNRGGKVRLKKDANATDANAANQETHNIGRSN